jgi:hypothetical protein
MTAKSREIPLSSVGANHTHCIAALRHGISNSISHCMQKRFAAGIDNSDVRFIDSERYPAGGMVDAAQCLDCFPDVLFDKRSDRRISTAAVRLDLNHGVI